MNAWWPLWGIAVAVGYMYAFKLALGPGRDRALVFLGVCAYSILLALGAVIIVAFG